MRTLYQTTIVKAYDAAMSPADGTRPAIGFVLVRLAERIDRGFTTVLRELDLTARQLRVMVALDEDKWTSQRALAASMQLDAGNLVAVLDALEKAGHVTRKADPDDRRRHALELTPAGRRLLRRARNAAAAVDDEVLGAFTDDEREQFDKLSRMAWG